MDANAAPSLTDLLNHELGTNFIETPLQWPLPFRITPCMTDPSNANPTPEPFHLLTCGHIVFIHDQDCHCGPNCHHTNTFTQSGENTTTPQTHPHIGAIQAQDTLYCETCTGIPFDLYIATHPPTTFSLPNNNPQIRRCLALTRTLLQSYTNLPNEDFNTSTAPLSFGQTLPNSNAHTLLCSHEVFGVESRPCAVNCVGWRACRGRIAGGGGVRSREAILCEECVGRAGLVYLRFARGEVERAVRGWEEERDERV
ncbi:hypothetical protein T440DRAFT_519366 [Plenodomus tracheiphilus IPT5]|uniref:Uncharacterized protein n=1 Tax=Plenodomus tracheiphilus IPT5 TaxID=1408161 RepID=A0A6A7B0S6_9PLEO|nr:hypothetical protein T440DRAFT_519366 [Plenodomus tracheiphilus IPT5]